MGARTHRAKLSPCADATTPCDAVCELSTSKASEARFLVEKMDTGDTSPASRDSAVEVAILRRAALGDRSADNSDSRYEMAAAIQLTIRGRDFASSATPSYQVKSARCLRPKPYVKGLFQAIRCRQRTAPNGRASLPCVVIFLIVVAVDAIVECCHGCWYRQSITNSCETCGCCLLC